MNPGLLNKRTTIQKFVPVDDGGGGKTGQWQTVATVWAGIKHLNGREQNKATQVVAEVTTEFKLRYLQGITPDMRIVYQGREFDIKRTLNVGEGNRELVIQATEAVKRSGS